MTIRKISGTDNYYIFVVTGNGYFIHERVENKKFDRVLSRPEKFINKGSGLTNILSLQKSGKDLDFYINSKLVGKAPFSPFFGDYLGCVIYSGPEEKTLLFLSMTRKGATIGPTLICSFKIRDV